MATETAVAAAGLFKVTVGEFSVAISTERILGIERADRAGDCPVISLAELLRPGQEAPPHNGPVLLAEIRGERIGFRVDKVTPLPRATRPRICETPSPLGVGRYSGVAMLPDGPLPIVDLEGLLFGADEAAPRPVGRGSPKGTDASHTGLGRLVVVGHFDYPKTGGRTVGFGLSAGCIEEVTDAGPVPPVAGVSAHLLGLVDWRGQALPKVDPAAWCGLPARPRDGGRVVVLRVGGGGRIAVAAGHEVKTIRATADHVEGRSRLPLTEGRVAGVYEFSGVTVVVPYFTPDLR